MKAIFHRILLVAATSSLCFSPLFAKKQTEQTKNWDKQPMSMYIWHRCLKDSNFIKRIDFNNFDNVYLMDGQHWKSVDEFDAAIDQLNANNGETYYFTGDPMFRFAIDEAHKVGTKALCTFGNDCMYAWDDVRRPKLVKLITDVVRNHNLDGVDIDWEIDVWLHHDKHAQLMAELRHSLDSLGDITGRDYLLTTALSVEAHFADSLQRILADNVDWINIMSYDIGGCLWRNHATHNTALKQIADSINSNWNQIPRHKLHLGLASYGFLYTGILPGEVLPEGQRLDQHGTYIRYSEVVDKLYGPHPWRAEFDPVQKCYYFYNPDKKEFITIDTTETIGYKFDYVVEAGLGGTFWWEYWKDIIPDKQGCSKWKHMLVPDHKKIAPKKAAKQK